MGKLGVPLVDWLVDWLEGQLVDLWVDWLVDWLEGQSVG